jgi:hypothetical protein
MKSLRVLLATLFALSALLAMPVRAADEIVLKPIQLSEQVWLVSVFGYPAFEAANRVNAYGTYLLLKRESLQQK